VGWQQRLSQLVRREVIEGHQLNYQPTQPPVTATDNGNSLMGMPTVFDTHHHPTQTTTTILTAEQLSAILPLHQETIRRWAREGRIPHRRLGRKIVSLRAEIDAWIASGRLFTSVMPPNPERMAA